MTRSCHAIWHFLSSRGAKRTVAIDYFVFPPELLNDSRGYETGLRVDYPRAPAYRPPGASPRSLALANFKTR